MNRARRIVSGVAAICVLALPLLSISGLAAAQSARNPVIAIIDMQRILRESLAVKVMQRDLEQQRSSFQGELKQKEEALRNTDQELARQRAVLSADAYAKRRQELEREVARIQREIQERRKGLDEIYGQGMRQVRLRLIDIVQSIANARGADLVLAKANVVLVRPDLEITEEALERLNQELPSVALSVPQN